MATIVTMFAVIERLQNWFAENGRSQLTDGWISQSDGTWKAILADAKHEYLQKEDLMQEAKRLTKILYSIEDVVESYKVEVASSTSKGIIKRIINCKANNNFRAKLSRLPDQISSLTDQIGNFFLELDRYSRLEPSRENNLRRCSSWTWSPWSDDDVIKIKEVDEELVSALTGGPRDLQVISLCGMGGSGKTTLARSLYNRPEVRYHFHVMAWVSVSQKFRTRDIFAAILQMVGSDISMSESKNEMDLAQAVYKHLLGNRWLVVLDDVWSVEAWESTRVAFPVSDKRGSRVLVTTRHSNVAVSLSGEENFHDMRFFDEQQSWELFKRITELGDAELNSKQEKIARKVLRQSRGLPLAIVVLADVLKSICVNKWELLTQYSDAEIGGIPIFDAARRILELSYNILPIYLMPCLLYMGKFPEGSKIEVDKLCQLWIAECLVSEKECENGETLIEVARRYFDELAARNLVCVPEDPCFKYGSLHDLIRDICIAKAKEEEFFDIVTPWSENVTKDSVFRRAIYLDKKGDAANIAPYNLGLKLRSLLLFNSFHESEDQELIVCPRSIYDLRNIKWMRVLHFDGVDFKGGIPVGIGNLVLLRYLSFRDCYLEELPSSISNLLFLITLDLQARKSCRVIIPNTLFKLERLRHLYLPLKFQTDNRDKLLLDGMKELEILENFDTSTCVVGEIFKLTSFSNLVVVSADGNLKNLEQILKCIESNANHLKKTSLSVSNFDSYSDERLGFVKNLFECCVLNILRLEGRIDKMPESDTFSKGFTEIHLNGCQLEEHPMRTLEMLPNLRILVLEVEAFMGKIMHCSRYGFCELRSLKLSKLYNLESWEIDAGAMPKLSTLSIENCGRMKMFPEGLEYINTLRKLKINMMRKEFVDKLRQVYGREGEVHSGINTKCTIEIGSDDPCPKFTDSPTEQIPDEPERDVYLQ